MKRTAFADALIILALMAAVDGGELHGYIQMFFGKLYGFDDGKIRVALAAPGTPNCANGVQ